MICPKCQFENPDGVKFCVECGSKLEIICSKCGYENFPSYKFCGECGQGLTSSTQPPPKDLSFAEKFDKIQRYLPKGLTDKILAQKKRIEGERKVVTIMFCDMKGFTPLTEKLGPEETFSFMDKVFEIFIHKVHEYEGIVNEMRGDGILAFFGVPITLEDAPQRAIRSAYAIHRAMIEFNETIIGNRDIPPVLIRIGINTGSVVVGSVGNDLRIQFTAVGDTINMASRVPFAPKPY
jgi:class 3 adenylate cyclase